MKSTSHVCCILPPHILHKLSEHPEHRQRALRALAITERLRGRREVFAQFAAGLSAGQKRRTIYDAQHQTELPGTLIRGEDDDKPRSTLQSMKLTISPVPHTIFIRTHTIAIR
jgi:hypothetical protein